jgi:hypothetical protein
MVPQVAWRRGIRPGAISEHPAGSNTWWGERKASFRVRAAFIVLYSNLFLASAIEVGTQTRSRKLAASGNSIGRGPLVAWVASEENQPPQFLVLMPAASSNDGLSAHNVDVPVLSDLARRSRK